MSALKVRNVKDEVVGEVKLSAFWTEHVHEPLVHQAVVAALADRRAGTHATRTRKEVSGGGRKPFKQKGTGRARQGTIRAPQMRGGGTIFGPQMRDYSQRMNKKAGRKALRSALAFKAATDSLLVVDRISPATHRTGDLVKVMDNLGIESALLVVEEVTENLRRASRNLAWIKVVPVSQINVYDVLLYGKLVVTAGALSALEGALAP